VTSRRLFLTALALATVAAPAAADEPPTTGGAQAPTSPATQGVISAQGAHVTLSARAGSMHGRVTRFRGSAPAGRDVVVEQLDSVTGAWIMLARSTAAADGTYSARWRTSGVGAHRVRAVLDRDGGAAAATTAPELGITVHRSALATWYGPGFYGRRTACGQRMSRALQGVAHKTLPCGTRVSLLYRGRRITVPVVDRGPYAAGKQWDLTSATATALRFTHTDRVGAVRVQP
jgi:peptidoglycan lytic transglycosylase